MKSPVAATPFSEEQLALLARMNFDEAKVPPYRLPEALVCNDGQRVDSPELWREKRRPELLRLFETHVYGRMFPKVPIEARTVEESAQALGGRATRRQVEIRFPGTPGPVLHLVIYFPNAAAQPAPCFLGLNFNGNHAAFDDPAIPLSSAWMRTEAPGVVENRATEASRATQTSRWPVETIIGRGYALATLCYGDLDPDYDDGFQNGVHPMFFTPGAARCGDDAGAITAWAWGLSRVMDYLETVERIDPARVCVTGHSRLGKTALWAGACDERFALVVSNNSGCGGASLNRRNFGETLHILSNVRPHWFNENCRNRSLDAEAVPVDQHQLIGLIAPRPVFVSSAEDDPGADPKGEFTSAFHADDVYRLLGTDGMAAEAMPPVNQPVLSRIGYYVRSGKHDINLQDWTTHLDFADAHLGRNG
ncbi:MAG TPA: acetylxylan esterase [Chthoniobacteraceae bacterium]|nr:acetylxylan esterase [Chthoniobacteraceae bacterium]